MSPFDPDPFFDWYQALEARHRRERSFAEIRRSIQVLSALYVQERKKLAEGRALSGAGKRAAFALYFAPLHFLLLRHVVRALGAASPEPAQILDLGCGTGVAGAAWALEARRVPRVTGIDRNAWALSEARWNFGILGISGRLRSHHLGRVPIPDRSAVVAAFAVNELAPGDREPLLERLLSAGARGVRVLIVEPIAKRPLPWWPEWAARFAAQGGWDRTWRFPLERDSLPRGLQELERASGLDHRELSARTLWL